MSWIWACIYKCVANRPTFYSDFLLRISDKINTQCYIVTDSSEHENSDVNINLSEIYMMLRQIALQWTYANKQKLMKSLWNSLDFRVNKHAKSCFTKFWHQRQFISRWKAHMWVEFKHHKRGFEFPGTGIGQIVPAVTTEVGVGPYPTAWCGTTSSHQMTQKAEARIAPSWSSETPRGSWPLDIAGAKQTPAIYSAWRT